MRLDSLILFLILVLLPLLSLVVVLLWAAHGLRRPTPIALEEAPPPWFCRRFLLFPAWSVILFTLLAGAWGAFLEPEWVEVTRTEIAVSRPVLGHDRFRIVHLSDLHLEGPRAGLQTLRDAVWQAKPHLVLLTGDLLNRKEAIPLLQDLIREFEPPYGIYAVPGYWDRKFPLPVIFGEIRRTPDRQTPGPRLLSDDFELIREGDHRLLLIGQDSSPHRTLDALLEGASENSFKIYLCHDPAKLHQLRSPSASIDLALCGSGHGGQVCLPFWGPVIRPPGEPGRLLAGRHDLHGVPVYLNRGFGMQGGWTPRLRILCRPEVAILDLTYSEKDGE